VIRIRSGADALACSLFLFFAQAAATQEPASGEEPLPEIEVRAARVANERPAGTFAAPATLLRFDPQTELQSRGLPEGQADVTVRGGLFENTGFRVGAVTLMDPQTGHYVAELPLAPAMLTAPEILTGIDNALAGFNSNIATVNYALPRVREGGALQLGAGSDRLRFGSAHLANVVAGDDGAAIGVVMSVARSQGDGNVADGDHEFARYNVQLQRSTASTQSDLVLALQDKFYGWPGAYTGFATLPETDDTRTTLVFASHRRERGAGWLQVSAYHRQLVDDYDFNRRTSESGTPGAFEHETRVSAVGIDGLSRRGAIAWHYAAQLTSDELVRSTDLTNGRFTTRDYATLSVVPEIELSRDTGRTLTLRAGGTVDVSSRDSDAFSPLLGVVLTSSAGPATRRIALEYAGTTQLPGYTALASGPSGLFGGNPDLGREKARQIMLSFAQKSADRSLSLGLFYREDIGLVDWTYARVSPFLRQANAVDLDVLGVEALYRQRWKKLELVIGYTHIDKNADYGAAEVDASFYALNFARQRATAALRFALTERIELRLDNEYREQEANPLRASADEAFFVSTSLSWEPERIDGLAFAVTADNLTDDDYQPFPGTPAVGRQLSLGVRYAW
jgi:hypothetical protein